MQVSQFTECKGMDEPPTNREHDATLTVRSVAGLNHDCNQVYLA
jgi:hypothetical protein